MSQGTTKGMPIDVDVTFTDASNLVVSSQLAVKTYADTKISPTQTSSMTVLSCSFASTSSFVNTLNQTVSASNFHTIFPTSQTNCVIVGNGSITSSNANKLLTIGADGTIKTIDQIGKMFATIGTTPYQFGFGETSTVTRFTSYLGYGGTFVNARGWPQQTVTSTVGSYSGFNPKNGSTQVTPQAKYGHIDYGLNFAKPMMFEVDLLNYVVGASAEFSIYLSAQENVVKSITATSGSSTVLCADTSGVFVGQQNSVATGPGTIAGGSYVTAVVNNVSITYNNNATVSGAGSWWLFGNPSGIIQHKGFGFRYKSNGTIRLESHNGVTATTSSYVSSSINTSYVAASTLSSKIQMFSDATNVYLYANETYMTSITCPTGLSTSGSGNLLYYTIYQSNLNGNGSAHTVLLSNPRIFY